MYQLFNMPVFRPINFGVAPSPPLRASQSLSAMQEIPQYPGNALRKYLIANPEIEAEKKGGDKHHDRRAVNFLLARPGHALHLRPNVGNILPNLNPRIFFNTDLLAHGFLCIPTAPTPVLGALAGAEGFEPPRPVLETGSLAVELTPL